MSDSTKKEIIIVNLKSFLRETAVLEVVIYLKYRSIIIRRGIDRRKNIDSKEIRR